MTNLWPFQQQVVELLKRHGTVDGYIGLCGAFLGCFELYGVLYDCIGLSRQDRARGSCCLGYTRICDYISLYRPTWGCIELRTTYACMGLYYLFKCIQICFCSQSSRRIRCTQLALNLHSKQSKL